MVFFVPDRARQPLRWISSGIQIGPPEYEAVLALVLWAVADGTVVCGVRRSSAPSVLEHGKWNMPEIDETDSMSRSCTPSSSVSESNLHNCLP
jgi:hypothetical protein